jgi:hypothetical protein
MVADHMGHDLNIHTNIYRLQSSLVERGKVARILLAADSGQLHKFDATQDLDGIDLDKIPLRPSMFVLGIMPYSVMSNFQITIVQAYNYLHLPVTHSAR